MLIPTCTFILLQKYSHLFVYSHLYYYFALQSKRIPCTHINADNKICILFVCFDFILKKCGKIQNLLIVLICSLGSHSLWPTLYVISPKKSHFHSIWSWCAFEMYKLSTQFFWYEFMSIDSNFSMQNDSNRWEEFVSKSLTASSKLYETYC